MSRHCIGLNFLQYLANDPGIKHNILDSGIFIVGLYMLSTCMYLLLYITKNTTLFIQICYLQVYQGKYRRTHDLHIHLNKPYMRLIYAKYKAPTVNPQFNGLTLQKE